MAHRAAEELGVIQPPPASAAAVDPVRLRRPVRSPRLPAVAILSRMRLLTSIASGSQLAALPSSPTSAVDGAMENGLPDDPLVEVLSRLPAKSICRFKCVSKPWRDLITDRLHCRML